MTVCAHTHTHTHTHRWSKKRFRKAKCPIVERLTCSVMMHGRNNGKKVQACRIMRHTFELIHLITEQNPIQVCHRHPGLRQSHIHTHTGYC